MNRRRFVRVPLALLVAAGALVAVDRYVTPLTPLRAAASIAYGTAENAIGSLTRRWGDSGRVQTLEQENARLRADLLTAQTQRDVSGRQSALSASSATWLAGRRSVSAHVVAIGRDQRVTIDAGTRDGLTPDLTVFDASGLVGRVTWAGPVTSTVALATDAASSVGVRMAGSDEVGLVTGIPGQGLLKLSLLRPDAPLKPGDQVVTMGSQNLRPYVPGVPVGTVVSVENTPGTATRTAVVRPYARLSALNLVAVVVVGT
ncbi:rod shape-determining protein MreC [Streptosporangiaceae bacterium NEAU-GS5]|nr:rod shape-determining protein MreC [Streptosporangiaceae bacterium NEAU-GS5]